MANVRNVTSTLDDGEGTLRDALRSTPLYTSGWEPLANGDVITFDDSLEVDGVITITLAADSTHLTLPAKEFIIEGGGHTGSGETLQTRVVIDAAANENDKRRVATVSSGCKVAVKNITFTNGYIIELTATNAWGGCIWFNTSSTSSPSFEFCVFKNCQAYQGGAFGSNNGVSYTVSDSLFKSNSANNNGGGIFCQMSSSSQNLISLYNDTFISNTSRNGGGIGTYNYANMIVESCVFSGNISTATTTQSADINITGYTTCVIKNTRAESTSSNNININNSTVTITNLTTASVVLNSTATIVFDGVDSIFAVTTTFSGSSATYAATTGSTGYLALPVGETAPTVGTGVKTCTYGAGASDFHAQITSATTASLSWTQTDSDVPVLLEAQESESDTWTTLSTSATSPYTVTDDDIDDLTFRIFDGESFYTAAGSYTFAKFYQVVAGYVPRNNDTTPHSWQTVIKLLTVNEMNENLKPGQDCAILARVYDAFDNDSPLLNLGSNISSVYYTCEKKMKSLYDAVWTPVTGHNNVSAGADCVLSSLQTDDAWDIDNVGYNFLLSPEISTHPLFETAGLYRIKATINPVDGDPITFYKEINVVE